MTTNGQTKRGDAQESSPEIKKREKYECGWKAVFSRVAFSSFDEEQTLAEMGGKDCGSNATGEESIGLTVPRGSMMTCAWTWSSAEPL